MDIDAHEVGRNHAVEVGIVGDAKAVAQQLLEALRAGKQPDRASGAPRSPRSRRGARRACEAEQTLPGDPMMPQRVFPELRKVLPRDCMVTLDAGIAPGLTYDRLDFELPRTFFNYAGHGGLGHGLCHGPRHQARPPRAAGVEHTGRRRIPVHLAGNQHRRAPPHTAREPRAQQQLPRRGEGAAAAHFDKKYVGVDLVNPRFDKLAEVYGAKGYYVTRPQDIAETVAAALKLDVPSVIEIPVPEYFPLAAKLPGSAGH